MSEAVFDRLLEGEDPGTERTSEAGHWVTIYAARLALWEERLQATEAGSPEAGELRREIERLRRRHAFWLNRYWGLRGLEIDTRRGLLTHREVSVPLSHREAQLLEFLARRPGRSFRPRVLVTGAWGDAGLSDEQLRTYIVRLRQRLAAVKAPVAIESHRREGYRLAIRS